MKTLLFTFAFGCAAIGFMNCADAQSSNFTATKTGVGPVRLDAKVAQLPASHERLYDAFKLETISEEDMGDVYTYEQVTFTLGDEIVMTARLSEGMIVHISVESSNIATPNGIAPGTNLREVLAAGGKIEMRNNGPLIMAVGDFIFEAPGDLTQSGSDRFDRIWSTGTAEDFTAEDFNIDAMLGKMIFQKL